MKRKQGIMTDDIFNTVLQQLIADRIDPIGIGLNGFGDPLTDGHFTDRVRAVRSKFPDTILKIHTNLIHPRNKNDLVDLCSCGLNEINISLNASSPEEYEGIMGVDRENYFRVTTNLDQLIHIAASKGIVVRVSMAVTSVNEAKASEFVRAYKSKVASIALNPVHTWGGTVADLSGAKKAPAFGTLPCKALWTSISIMSDGKLATCCLDYDGNSNLPSVDNGIIKAFHCDKPFFIYRYISITQTNQCQTPLAHHSV